ncbi:MAG: TOBE domain-containing protein [Alishewanella aestuarii]
MPTSLSGSFIAPLQFSSGQGDISARRLALLQAVAESGSIAAAAKIVGITYKAAWDGIDAINNLADEPLVILRQGGSGGGGAQLTPTGLALLQRFAEVQQLQQHFMAQVNQSELTDTFNLIRRFNMKTSARNTLYGEVQSVQTGAVNSEVILTLTGGDSLCAVITKESADKLGLVQGKKAYALIKSSWIVLAKTNDTLQTSARNQFVGTVSRVVAGAVNSEVVLELAGGNTLAAMITQHSAEVLQLQPGDKALALIKASHIIIGIDD